MTIKMTYVEKAKTLRKALKYQKLPQLQTLVYDILGLIYFDHKLNRKQPLIDIIVDYYLDTNYPNSYTISSFDRYSFKSATYYYCRKNIKDYIDGLPYKF